MRTLHRSWLLIGIALGTLCGGTIVGLGEEKEQVVNARKPKNEAQLQQWLENMAVYHEFTPQEMADATGMTTDEVEAALQRLKLAGKKPAARKPDDPLTVLPYPGGRHPRIGFLDGAVNPQRETKVSIFAPWRDGGYVVADVPEAIWVQTGDKERELLYLAHTHVPTRWDRQKITLEPLEWERDKAGGLKMERKLPDGTLFGTRVVSTASEVRMEMWLTNGTADTLRGLVVQNCVMLKGLRGFEQQTADNKVISKPYVACKNPAGNRWIITAWEPCVRPWTNPPCPCLHSDPQFPDCPPGKTVRLQGWLSFYEGEDIEGEFKRIAALKWSQEGKE